jgi:acyl-CoA thioester hydrolase
MPRSEYRCSHSIRVRWAEVDPQAIVFNANYFMYFDVAVTEYWRALGLAYPEGLAAMGLDTLAVKATAEFHRSARYDDEIDLLARIARLGRTSMSIALEIHRGDEHLVSGEIVYVVADATTRTPTPIPDSLRETILRYEHTPPEQAAGKPR